MQSQLHPIACPAPLGPHFHPLVVGLQARFPGEGDKQIGVGEAIGNAALEDFPGSSLGEGVILHIQATRSPHGLVQGHQLHPAVVLARGIALDELPHGFVHSQ